MVRSDTGIRGLRELRTMQSAKKRAMPRTQSSVHLDLYVLYNEKKRVEKEIAVLGRRKAGMEKRLAEIEAETEKLETKKNEKRQANPGENPLAKDKKEKEWKSMRLKY